MAETRTSRFGLPQWGENSDNPSRTDFNEAFLNIETRAAWDDGTTASALPTTGLIAGRYFRQSYTDGYALYRRSASAWEWVGGTVVAGRVRYRATADSDVMVSVDQGDDSSTKLSVSGNGDVVSQGGVRALTATIGTTTTTPAPATTGRLYVRTTASGERGVVSSAHASSAGNLFTADVGGSAAWAVDSLGRMRASAPVGLGGSAPVTDTPLTVSPGATDVTALDVYAAVTGDKPGLRVLRNAGDTTPILEARPDLIRVGRTTWSGGVVEVKAPTVSLTGTVGVTGGVTASGSIQAYGSSIPMPVTVNALADVTAPVDGQAVYLKPAKAWLFRDGGAWVELQSIKYGRGQVGATRLTGTYGPFSSEVIAATVTVPVVADRLYRVVADLAYDQPNTSYPTFSLRSQAGNSLTLPGSTMRSQTLDTSVNSRSVWMRSPAFSSATSSSYTFGLVVNGNGSGLRVYDILLTVDDIGAL